MFKLLARALPVLVFSLPLSAPASAQPAGSPNKPVTIVVAFAAGGVVDGMSRIVGRKLSDQWQRPVVVENKAGGGTVIGTQQVANATADGATILATSMAYTTNQFLMKKLPYDVDALTPLAMIATAPNMLLVHPSVPASNVKELVALAKAKPGTVTLASAGNGSSQHMALELFASETGIDIVHVPHKGTAPALMSAIGGQVSGAFDTSLQAVEFAKQGKLKPLAVSSSTRLAAAPDVPTFSEAGYPSMQALTWVGLFVPSKTPPEVRNRLFEDVRRALADKDVREGILKLGFEPATPAPDAFAGFLASEHARLGAIIREKKITLD